MALFVSLRMAGGESLLVSFGKALLIPDRIAFGSAVALSTVPNVLRLSLRGEDNRFGPLELRRPDVPPLRLGCDFRLDEHFFNLDDRFRHNRLRDGAWRAVDVRVAHDPRQEADPPRHGRW